MMRKHFPWIAVLLTLLAAPVGAAESVSCKETDEILAELRRIRTLLENQPNAQIRSPTTTSPTTTRVDVTNAPFLGSKDALLAIVEFTDYQCRFCQLFYQQTFQDLKVKYIESGKVRFYSMDLPLDIHKNALLAAQAGRCTGEQGQFWEMHDRMQASPDRLEMGDLIAYAQEVGIDVAAFRLCVGSGKYKEDIQREARDAASMGARGTPAFVIGKNTPAGVEGELVVGAVAIDVFEQKLKEHSR